MQHAINRLRQEQEIIIRRQAVAQRAEVRRKHIERERAKVSVTSVGN
jgi:hypothetical protein